MYILSNPRHKPRSLPSFFQGFYYDAPLKNALRVSLTDSVEAIKMRFWSSYERIS